MPDHRSSQGRRHPLAAVLALSVAAMLSGARSLYAIWQWGRMQDAQTVRALGFTRAQTPAVSTLRLVFSQLDVEAFEAALRRWAQEELEQTGEAIAIDGKGLRGIHGEELPGVRLVAAYAVGAGQVLAQEGVRKKERKGELKAALRLLGKIRLQGQVVTGDALYAQRKVCEQILKGGGDYLVAVKQNQPQLHEDIALLFEEPPFGEVFDRAEQRGKRGDRYEVGRLWASSALREYLDWPGVSRCASSSERSGGRERRVRGLNILSPACHRSGERQKAC